MNADAWIALGSLIVAVLVMVGGYTAQRWAKRIQIDAARVQAELVRSQRENALVDQIQEERNHALTRGRELGSDLEECRERVNEGLDRIDTLLEFGREKDRKIAALAAQIAVLEARLSGRP